MQRYTNSVILYQDRKVGDDDFNADEAAPVKVTLAGTATLATLFADDAGTIPLAQPFLTNALNQGSPGRFTFVAGNGTYDIVINEGPGESRIEGVTLYDPINDLSQPHMFDTVAGFKASVIEFPDGKTIHLNDRGADFLVVAGTGTATGNGIIASTSVNQSIVLVQKSTNTIDMYGAANGVNSSSAINEAIAIHSGYLNTNSSGYIIDAQLNFISGTCTGLKGQGEIDTVFNKAFDGDMIINNNQGATFSDFWVVGDSGSYSGGGFYMVSDDSHISRVRVTDTQDSCIIFKANDATSNTVDDCFLQAAADGYAIRGDGVDLSPSPSARIFNRLRGGSALVNFAGMNRAILSDSFGTRIGFDANCSKIGISNNRLTNAASDITVLGQSHVISGNIFGFGTGFNLIIDSTCVNVTYDDSNVNSVNGAANSSIQDNSVTGNVGNSNSLATVFEVFTTEWKGATTDGVYGNSSVTMYFTRNHRTCFATIGLVRGSTATLPSGSWSFTLPFKALVASVGSLLVKSPSGGQYRAAQWKVAGGSNEAFLFADGETTAVDETTFPFGTNGIIEGTIIYQIASS